MIELQTEEPQKNRVNKWRLYWFHESDLDANYPADAETLVKAGFTSNTEAARVLNELQEAHVRELSALRAQLADTAGHARRLEEELKGAKGQVEALETECDEERCVVASVQQQLDAARADLAAKDACWHCKDALLPTRPRCEACPDECDDEACSEEGCREARDQQSTPAPVESAPGHHGNYERAYDLLHSLDNWQPMNSKDVSAVAFALVSAEKRGRDGTGEPQSPAEAESAPAPESAKAADGEVDCARCGKPDVMKVCGPCSGAMWNDEREKLEAKQAEVIRERYEERHTLRNALGNLVEAMKVSGSQPVPTVFKAFQQAERAFAQTTKPSPTSEQDSSPSPDTVGARDASDESRNSGEGDGAGATSATEEAKPAECNCAWPAPPVGPSHGIRCPAYRFQKPEQKAAFAVGDRVRDRRSARVGSVRARTDIAASNKLECVLFDHDGQDRLVGQENLEPADPAPPAEVPLTRSELVASIRNVVDGVPQPTSAVAFGRFLADELEKRKES